MDYFNEQMRMLLGARYTEFTDAAENKPRHKALRVNTLKIGVAEFAELSGYSLKQNPLCPESFYSDVKPSLDPLYHAGLYYMQEPSASAAVAALAPYVGERVLDLCAAPGGKSTQAAAYMNKSGGVIFCNDVEPKRVKALAENVARLGVRNAVITSGDAQGYRAAGFDGYFDTLIVDAPCSGGGMMRYETVPYSAEIVEGCARRQRAILDDAAELLRQGGYMLYSTCTFSVEENENNVRYLLDKGFVTVDIPLLPGVERGVDLPDGRRIYPHNFDGEGHFYCVLQKRIGYCSDMPIERVKHEKLRLGGLTLDAVNIDGGRFLREFDMPIIKRDGKHGIAIVRAGVPVFEQKGGDVTHELTHALTKDQTEQFGTIELSEQASRYIRGEQIDMDAPHGVKIATVRGYALGLCKAARAGDGESVIKNLYPKALRIQN